MKKIFLAAVAVSAVAVFAEEACTEGATTSETSSVTGKTTEYVCVAGSWVAKGEVCAPGQTTSETSSVTGKTTNYICNEKGDGWEEVIESSSSAEESSSSVEESSDSVEESSSSAEESSSSVEESSDSVEESSSSEDVSSSSECNGETDNCIDPTSSSSSDESESSSSVTSSETATEGESSSSEDVSSSSECNGETDNCIDPTSSSSSVEESSSSVEESSSSVETKLVLDDFNDGDGTANNLGEEVYWYIYTSGGATVANTQDANKTWDMITKDGDNGYAAMKGISGVTFGATTYPGAGIGLDVPANSLAKCTVLTYKYKGSAHKFRAGLSTVTANNGFEHITTAFEAAGDWTSVTVKVADLVQPDWIDASEKKDFSWSLVNKIAWVVDEKIQTVGTELDIDDVTCELGDTPIGSSSSGNPEGSSASGADGSLIDDFSDGNNGAENIGADSYWYAYEAGGKITNAKDTYGFMVVDSIGGYAYLSGISGITPGATTYPSVGLGVNVDGALANCTAVTYDYMGSAHRFRAALSTVTADKGYEHTTKEAGYPASSGWSTVTVSASDLTQPDWIPATEKKTFSWAQVNKISWIIDEKIPSGVGSDLKVDNVKCVGTLQPASPASSSSAYQPLPTSSSSYNPYTAIGAVQARGSLKVSTSGSTLNISIAKAGLVKVNVFDMMGHAIETHVENMAAGTYGHSLANLSKGAYIVRVQQGSEMKVIRTQVR